MEKAGLAFITIFVALGVVLGSLVYVYTNEGVSSYDNQGDDQGDDQNNDDTPDPNEGLSLARDFTLPRVGGGTLTLSSLRGKVVVLDFMATWCGPCAMEIPHLKQIDEAYASGVEVISIDVDDSESDALLASYSAEKGITWPVLRDVDGISSATGYQASSIPTVVIINKDGYIVSRTVGVETADALAAVINEWL